MFALLLVGAGCSSDSNQALQTPPPVAQPAPELVKKPITAQPTVQAYKFCEEQGNNIAMHYDEPAQKPVISCVFSNNTKCEIVQYFNGACGPNKTGQISPDTQDNSLTALRYCDKKSPPVCGADGHNYSNHCVAAQQNVKILHEGLCTESEQAAPVVPGKNPTPSSLDTSELSSEQIEAGVKPQVEINTGEQAAWLSILFDIIEAQKAKSPRSSVEKCSLNNDTYYYYQESCKDCFSVLYTEAGSVSCFPNNDITDSCSDFDTNNRKTYCKQIWRDRR